MNYIPFHPRQISSAIVNNIPISSAIVDNIPISTAIVDNISYRGNLAGEKITTMQAQKTLF